MAVKGGAMETRERITCENGDHKDDFSECDTPLCPCGNDVMSDGFIGANLNPPRIVGNWEGRWDGTHTVCHRCGRIYGQDGYIVARLSGDADHYFPCEHNDLWPAEERPKRHLKWCQDCGREWYASGNIVPMEWPGSLALYRI